MSSGLRTLPADCVSAREVQSRGHATRAGIGGALDYRALAELHRPQSDEAMRAEVRRLADTGLTDVDVATALRLPLDQVRSWLAGSPS